MKLLLLLVLAGSPAHAQETLRFPKPFFFGLATAPGQAEDGLNDIWTAWGRAGKIAGYSSTPVPDERLEFWSHPETELDWAARAGAGVYRLGVDWGRVEPAPHRFDRKALARYKSILQMAHSRHLKVMVTLMHHSVPAWLQARGGWLKDSAATDYLEFSKVTIAALHGQADWWISFNEPNVFAPLAYTVGLWPPGDKRPPWSLLAADPYRGETVQAMDRMAQAHDALYDWAHREYPDIKMGFALNMARYTGKTWFARLCARYPDYLLNWRFPEETQGHMDFFGVNYYGAEWVEDGHLVLDPAEEYSESGRGVDPHGLYELLKEIHARFPAPPVIVTENGVADSTDILRPAYLLEHLAAVARARAEGVPVQGYLFWTLSDNLEWSDGYCPKFGLLSVDRAHGLRRHPRPSFYLFRRVATTRVVTPAMRAAAWKLVADHAGKPRPMCRAQDAQTALAVPRERPFSRADWRFR